MRANDVAKTQRVRLMDVYLLGPFMVFAATLIPKSHQLTRLGLAVAGIGTSVYNWRNYRKVRATVPKSCPPATLDLELNTRHRDLTIRFFDYGPPNPALPNRAYWRKLACRWFDKITPKAVAQTKSMRCGNCAVFDISPAMRHCLPPVQTRDAYDNFAVGSGSVLGYCWAHKFKCASSRTCATWVEGGPIRTNARSPLTRWVITAVK